MSKAFEEFRKKVNELRNLEFLGNETETKAVDFGYKSKFKDVDGWLVYSIADFGNIEKFIRNNFIPKAEVLAVLDKCIEKPELSKDEWETKKRLVNYIAGELGMT